MDSSIRLPLTQGFEPRDNTLKKDELSTNIIYDKSVNGTTYAVKRPGLSSFIGALGKPTGYYAFQGNPNYYVPWEGTFGAFTYGNNFFGLGPPPPYIWAGGYANNNFVGIGKDPAAGFRELIFCTSTDAVTWTFKSRLATVATYANIRGRDVVWQGSNYVIILTTSTNLLWTSSSALTSFSDNSSDSTLLTYGIPSIMFAIPGLFIFSYAGSIRVLQSTNGVTWTAPLITGSYINTTVQGTSPTTFYALKKLSGITYSSSTINGTTFTNTLTLGDFPPDGSSIATLCNGNLWVACGTNKIYTSTDFITWSSVAVSGASIATNVKSVWGDGTNYFVLATNKNLFKSTDGITWTRQMFPSNDIDNKVSNIASNGTGAVVVFPLNIAGASLWNGVYSKDIKYNWLENTLPTYFNPLPSQQVLT